MDLPEMIEGLEEKLADASRALEEQKRAPSNVSRAVYPGASRELVEHVAKGGGYDMRSGELVAAGARSEPLAGRATHYGDRRGGGGTLAGAMAKALHESTGSAGGYLVAPEVAEDIARLILARSVIRRMGVRTVPVKKELAIDSVASGATAFYVAENGNVPVSEMTFAQNVILRPKELAALVPVSNRLLRDATEAPVLDQVLREDLAEIMALRADLAFLEGPGGVSPLGIRNTPGLTPAPSLGANGRAPTYDDLKDMVAALRNQNAPFKRPGWLMHPRTIATLEKVKDSTGQYLSESGLLQVDAAGGGGRLLAFPFLTSTQIPTNIVAGTSTDTSLIYFASDWDELFVGENQDLEIATSGEATYQDVNGNWVSAFQARQTLFRATSAHDIGIRRPSFFTILQGVRP